MKITTSKVNCNRYGNKGNNYRLSNHTESMIEQQNNFSFKEDKRKMGNSTQGVSLHFTEIRR